MIQPDKVQLNSLDRPGLYEWVQPADDTTLDRIAEVIGRSVPAEKIAKHTKRVENEAHRELDLAQYNERILKTLRSRPCTAEDLTVTIGIEREWSARHILPPSAMTASRKIMPMNGSLCAMDANAGGSIFYIGIKVRRIRADFTLFFR